MCIFFASQSMVLFGFGGMPGTVELVIVVLTMWVLPIYLGIRAAKRKHYSPHWMWFGVHPLTGWAACIVLHCLSARVACPGCAEYVGQKYRICPYCQASTAKSGDVVDATAVE